MVLVKLLGPFIQATNWDNIGILVWAQCQWVILSYPMIPSLVPYNKLPLYVYALQTNNKKMEIIIKFMNLCLKIQQAYQQIHLFLKLKIRLEKAWYCQG